MLLQRGRESLESLIAQENDPDGLSLAQVEQLADQDRDTHNWLRALAAAYQDLIDAGGCFCASDKRWLGDWPDRHQLGTCDCICDRCADSAEWATGLVAAEVSQKQLDNWYHRQLAQVGLLPWVGQAWAGGRWAYEQELDRCRTILARIRDGKVIEEDWQRELRLKVEAEQREKEAELAWRLTPEGRAEEERKQAEREAEWEARRARYEKERAERRERILAKREQMRRDGPEWGPLAIPDDPYESYRQCFVWASSGASVSGDPEDRTSYGRLFLVRQGGKTFGSRDEGTDLFFGADALFEQVSDENCTDNWVHKAFRDRDPAGRFGPYCSASCNSTFHMEQLRTLKQADAYLERRGVKPFLLPPDEDWARWWEMDIDQEVKERVWADQHWAGCWRLSGRRRLPPTFDETGYDPRSGWWFYQDDEQPALPPSQPVTLAGQLAAISRGSNVPYDMTAIAELLQRYGVYLEPRALQARLKRDAAELELEGIRVEPTGDKDPRTRRTTYRIVVAANPSDPSDSSAALPPGEMPEGS